MGRPRRRLSMSRANANAIANAKARDVSDVRARETKELERESAREASAAIVRRPTPTGKVDVSRQEMLEALARELDETESLLGTTKRTTEGERAMSVASLFAGGERYV